MLELVLVAVSGDVLADLPGNLVWDLSAVFLWHTGALLAGNLEWNLSSDLGALLPWHVSADGVDDVPDGGHAVGLGDGGALGGLDHALLLDWDLLADALDLALASGSNANSVSADGSIGSESVNGLGVSLGFGISLTLVHGNGGWESWGTGGGEQVSGNWASGSNGADGSWGNSGWDDSWGDTGWDNTGWNSVWLSNDGSGWVGNMLDLDLTLDTNQLSLLADLVFNILALFNVSDVGDGVGFVDTDLLVPGGTLLVWDLAGDWAALLLGHLGACGIEFGPELSLADGSASLLVGGGALSGVGGIVHSLANGVGHRLALVAVRLGVAVASVVPLVTAMISVASSVTSVVTAVVTTGLGVSLWLTHH